MQQFPTKKRGEFAKIKSYSWKYCLNLQNARFQRIVDRRSDVEELDIIRRRGFGTVERVRHRESGLEMVWKMLDLREAADCQRFRRELEILPAIKCDYIIGRVLSLKRDLSLQKSLECFGSFSEAASVHMVIEPMDVSMDGLIGVTGLVPEDYLKWIAFNVLRAVSYLEKELKTLHRG